KSRYPVELTRGLDMNLAHLGKLRELASLAKLDALLAAQSGRASEAATDVADMLALAATLDDEPIIGSYQVRLAIIMIAASTVENCLAFTEFSDEASIRLATAFGVMENPELKNRALIGERAAVTSAIVMFRFYRE